MYTLYYSPGACSTAVHVLLNELGVPFKLVNVSIAEGLNKSPEYLRINPRGTVPMLIDGAMTLRENAAILLYITEKHPGSLLPEGGPIRAKALEWLMFANASLHPAYATAFGLKKQLGADAAQSTFMIDTIGRINHLWSEVEKQLQASPYLCGVYCTLADILLTVFANWNSQFPLPITLGPNTRRMIAAVSSRPAYQQALQAEQIQYKAAA